MTSRYWWKLSEAYISFTTNSSFEPTLTGQERLPLNPFLFENVITAPAEFSFVCANTTGLSYIDTSLKTIAKNDTVYVQFNGFQARSFECILIFFVHRESGGGAVDLKASISFLLS